MRLIDADALISFMRKGWRVFPTSELQHTCDITDIANAPTIDAVPVVRCKECKHKGGFGCPWWKGEDIPTDWYCANGERMTDATD